MHVAMIGYVLIQMSLQCLNDKSTKGTNTICTIAQLVNASTISLYYKSHKVRLALDSGQKNVAARNFNSFNMLPPTYFRKLTTKLAILFLFFLLLLLYIHREDKDTTTELDSNVEVLTNIKGDETGSGYNTLDKRVGIFRNKFLHQKKIAAQRFKALIFTSIIDFQDYMDNKGKNLTSLLSLTIDADARGLAAKPQKVISDRHLVAHYHWPLISLQQVALHNLGLEVRPEVDKK